MNKSFLQGHGSLEGLISSSGRVDCVSLLIHMRDLAQRALGGAQDEATGLGHVNLNLYGKLKKIFLLVQVFYYQRQI